VTKDLDKILVFNSIHGFIQQILESNS